MALSLEFQSLQKLNTRRYDYIRSSNGKTFGKYDSCLQSSKVSLMCSYNYHAKIQRERGREREGTNSKITICDYVS